MKDDSIGIVLGFILKKNNIKNVHICETDIFYLLKITSQHPEILVIDAVDAGLAAGSFITVPLSGITKIKGLYLPHDNIISFDLSSGMLFGIQVKDIKLETGLSPKIKNNIKLYIKEIIKLLNRN